MAPEHLLLSADPFIGLFMVKPYHNELVQSIIFIDFSLPSIVLFSFDVMLVLTCLTPFRLVQDGMITSTTLFTHFLGWRELGFYGVLATVRGILMRDLCCQCCRHV